nr:tail fiber domain-containing protein [uncultured Psychroserpens sp.]
MKTKLTILACLFAIASIAQNGINYKALIKDANGNVLSNQTIDIKFKIQSDNGSTISDLYEESHSITTNQNGLTILNIGEGTYISGGFYNIDWNQTILLNTELDIEQDGTFIDLGSELFNFVPRAFYAQKAQIAQTAVTAQTANNVSGLEAASGGHRLTGQSMNVGLYAINLNSSFSSSTETGAMGNYSFASGRVTKATGYGSIAMGIESEALGIQSVALGGRSIAQVNYSYALGTNLITNSLFTTAIGRTNIGYGDSIFEIGNGVGSEVNGYTRSNQFTIFKNGNVHISQGLDTGLGTVNNGYILMGQANGSNISIDNNEIMARNNGNAADLNLQIEGGRVLIGGNVGIGTTNPQASLHLEGVLRIGDETISDAGNNALRINAALIPDLDNVNVIGNPSQRWNTIYATNGTINTSDRREKKNIKDLNYGLAEVLQMQPVSFNWKNDNNPDIKLGLIAQDLLELIPEVVKSHTWETDELSDTLTKKELDRLGVYYSDLVPVLIKAIQEQQKIITTQKEENLKQTTEISSITDTLKTLLSRIEDLESKQSN